MSDTGSTFRSDQIFYVMGEGWYAEAPEQVIGPYASREVAARSLEQRLQRSALKAERYFHVADNGWFVNTREGERGPFYSRREAERFVGQLVQNHRWHRRELW